MNGNAAFLNLQLTFPRVQLAKQQTDNNLRLLLRQNGVNYPPKSIYLRAFKQEQLLEIWASDAVQFKFIKSYTFTAFSGKIGPKIREGDLQIPEGLYIIDTFNPNSKFHLSFRINYPNTMDSVRNKNEQNPGSDIYIHGGNQTTGCIPIGDENIAELYWLCAQSYVINQNIPIHIFPCKMEEKNLHTIYTTFPEHIDFWNTMKLTYHYFQSHKMLNDLTHIDVNKNK
jgi:murein L,D-transpeptidase YafK